MSLIRAKGTGDPKVAVVCSRTVRNAKKSFVWEYYANHGWREKALPEAYDFCVGDDSFEGIICVKGQRVVLLQRDLAGISLPDMPSELQATAGVICVPQGTLSTCYRYVRTYIRRI